MNTPEPYTAKQALFDTLAPGREKEPLVPVLLNLIRLRAFLHRTSLFYYGLIPVDDIVSLRRLGYQVKITGRTNQPECIESYTITW